MNNSDRVDKVYEIIAMEAIRSPDAITLVVLEYFHLFGEEGEFDDDEFLVDYINLCILDHERVANLM